MTGHTGQVYSVVFSPDGKQLASASWDNTVKVWDTTSGQVMLTLKGHTERVLSVAFSPDGKQLASTSYHDGISGMVKVWDATIGEETLTLRVNQNEAMSVAFSPDGKHLAASDGQTVVVWNATSRSQKRH